MFFHQRPRDCGFHGEDQLGELLHLYLQALEPSRNLVPSSCPGGVHPKKTRWENGKIIGKPWENEGLPSGKLLHNYGKSPFFMPKSMISMAMFDGYVRLPEGTPQTNMEMIRPASFLWLFGSGTPEKNRSPIW